MLPIVHVHGGGLDSRCWERLQARLAGPSLAVDLPGRGAHPADLRSVTLAACAASVRDDVDAAGLDEVVLVGHSLAGCSMPATLGLLGARVRHAVFVACTVPDDGKSAYDMLDAGIQELIRTTRTTSATARSSTSTRATCAWSADRRSSPRSWTASRPRERPVRGRDLLERLAAHRRGFAARKQPTGRGREDGEHDDDQEEVQPRHARQRVQVTP